MDPTFASAYYDLSVTYGLLRNWKARREAIEKAKMFSHKTTEKERLFIEDGYAHHKENDQEKRFDILQQIIEKYPNEKKAHKALGIHYGENGDLNKAIEEYEKALKLDPNDGSTLNQIGWFYQLMDNLDKAVEYLEQSVYA